MTQEEYLTKLKRLEEIFQSKTGTSKGEKPEKLAKEIRVWEKELSY